MRAWLRARDVGSLTLKKRGASLDPLQFRHDVGKLEGSSEATLLLTTLGAAVTAIALG